MKILVIGGTVFVGRHFVEAALARGHEVVLFHRGSHPSPFEGVREILGDRTRDLSLAAVEEWDAIVDPSAYTPEHVTAVAEVLGARTKRYLLISTISVYADLSVAGMTEDAPLATLTDPKERNITGETYGALKALAEAAAMNGFGPERLLIVRPGLVVGPFDPTGRFTYWVERIAAGGNVLVPGARNAPMQFIDARDLASLMLNALEEGRTGTIHVTGPQLPIDMEALLTEIKRKLGSNAELVWASEALLDRSEGLSEQIPFWAPSEAYNMFRMNLSKATSMGLAIRPLSETIQDTWNWARSQGTNTMTARYLSRSDEEKAIRSVSEAINEN